MAPTAKKINKNQLEIIINFMMEHPELQRNKLSNTFTAKQRAALWSVLKDKLNAEGGAIKTIEKWQKCWTDYKVSLRSKYNFNLRQINKTGGGQPTLKFLSELDLRALTICNLDMARGLDVEETQMSPDVVNVNMEEISEAEMEDAGPESMDAFINTPSQEAAGSSNQTSARLKSVSHTPRRTRVKGLVVNKDNCASLIAAHQASAEGLNNIAKAIVEYTATQERNFEKIFEIEKQKVDILKKIAESMQK